MSLIKRWIALFSPKDIDVSGEWTGYYGYGDQYPEVLRHKKVQFVARISDVHDGYFTGTIQESEEGIPEVSEIEGRIRGGKIFFTKTYKKSYQVNETGERTIKEGPQYVGYSGFYDQSTNHFIGQWKIEATYVFEDGRKLNHVSIGPWGMTRSS